MVPGYHLENWIPAWSKSFLLWLCLIACVGETHEMTVVRSCGKINHQSSIDQNI